MLVMRLVESIRTCGIKYVSCRQTVKVIGSNPTGAEQIFFLRSTYIWIRLQDLQASSLLEASHLYVWLLFTEYLSTEYIWSTRLIDVVVENDIRTPKIKTSYSGVCELLWPVRGTMDQWWSDRVPPPFPSFDGHHHLHWERTIPTIWGETIERWYGVSMDTFPLCLFDSVHSGLEWRSCEGRLPRLAPLVGASEGALGPIGASVWPGLEPLFGVIPYCYRIEPYVRHGHI